VVYRAFAETGRAPEPGELATKLGTEAREVAAGLAELARGRHLALGGQGQIRHGASVLGRATRLLGDGRPDAMVGRLRWDSFALPHLLREEGKGAGGEPVPGVRAPARVERRPAPARRTATRWSQLPGADRADVGRRCAHVRPPAPVLPPRIA